MKGLPSEPERTKIFGRNIILVEHRDLDLLVSEIADRPSKSVFFCNVHMLMLSQEDKALADAMNISDLVFADGVPVAWLQHRLSGKEANVIRGYEIMLAVCKRATALGEKVGFMGSTNDVMNGLLKNLIEKFEGLHVAYRFCPPFMQGELTSTEAELNTLKASELKWLFVSLGCPKQEKWIAKYKGELDCNIFGVGAAFDWLSGEASMPPKWMERFALAWLYRLLHNPVKMWHRYLIYNSKFMVKAIRVMIRGK